MSTYPRVLNVILTLSSAHSLCALAAAGLPDQWTIIGGVVVIGGIVVLVVFDHERTEQEKRALEQRLPAGDAVPNVSIPESLSATTSSSFADDMREFATHDFHA